MRFLFGGIQQRVDETTSEHSLVTDGGEPLSTRVDPTLPPEASEPVRMVGVPGTAVSNYHSDTVQALVGGLNPDLLVAVPPQASTVDAALSPVVDVPVLNPGRSSRPGSVLSSEGDVLATTVPSSGESFSVDSIEQNTQTGPKSTTPSDSAPHRVCLTDQISLSVDPYERRTSVDGLDGYRDQLPDECFTSNTTHCSTALRAGYRATTSHGGDSCSLVGIGRSEASLGVGEDGPNGDTAALVEVYANGAVGVETVDPAAFGLRSVDGVGNRRAQTLRQAGYETPADIVASPLYELKELDGFGRSSSEGIQAAAKALESETAVATGDDSLPHSDPVFIDIETDGLEPSCVWLIGVLDGGATDGQYMAFEESKPGESDHIEAFLNWQQANAAGRPLVAWNGYSFDFPVLEDQIRQRCPTYADAWGDAYQFDLLWWARDKNGGNVALPGKDNKLESVAEALGWEPQTTGIDGGVVARLYSAYRRRFTAATDPGSVDEPDWGRLRRYCEDDVRALATIYDALAEAARRDPGTTSESKDTGTQGALSDFT